MILYYDARSKKCEFVEYHHFKISKFTKLSFLEYVTTPLHNSVKAYWTALHYKQTKDYHLFILQMFA